MLKQSRETDEEDSCAESSTTHDSISERHAGDAHHKNGDCCDTSKESKTLINKMAEALRRARLDPHPPALRETKKPSSAVQTYLSQHNIHKRILHTGNPVQMPVECSAPGGGGFIYPKLTKFIFDYRIRDPNVPEVFLDDTKKYGKQMELYCGKDFQIEFWEYCLQSMLVGEVASFMVPPRQLIAFPAVNKKLRDYMLDKTGSRGSDNAPKHSCAFMSLQAHGGLGYPDLDDLVKKPRILEFIFDLQKIILPNDAAQKESWIMTTEEKLETIPKLRLTGNDLYSVGQWFEAAAKYEEALNLIEQLTLAEKPGDPEFVRLDQMRVPFLLNMAQCQFKLKDYYGTIKSTTEVLSRDTNNVKALFRRGQAYSATSDVQQAEADFCKVKELAPTTMTATVNHELAHLEEISRKCRQEERRLLAGKMFNST